MGWESLKTYYYLTDGLCNFGQNDNLARLSDKQDARLSCFCQNIPLSSAKKLKINLNKLHKNDFFSKIFYFQDVHVTMNRDSQVKKKKMLNLRLSICHYIGHVFIPVLATIFIVVYWTVGLIRYLKGHS